MPLPLLYLLRGLLLACLGLAATQGRGAGLELSDAQAHVDAWPAVTLLADPQGRLDATQALQRSAEFSAPTGPHANLGLQTGEVWLRVPLQVQGAGRWVLEIDYPALDRADLYHVADGLLRATHRLGRDQPFAQRPLKTRAHAAALELMPGAQHVLLLRVRSTSSVVVPLTLHRADAFLTHEGRRQLLQGLMLGVALALLSYSLINAIDLRDPLFAFYGVMVAGLSLFFLAFGGIGPQHLWSGWDRAATAKLAPLGVLVAIAAGCLFVADALDTRKLHPFVTRGLHAAAAAAGLAFTASAAGLLDYRSTQAAATLLGLLPLLLAVRVALLRALQGDRAARMMLVGWGVYLVGAASMAGLLRGLLPANFWTLHLFQFSALLEMLVWMRVLSLRVEGVQREAERVELEHNALRSLAHTDALTGLPNRRGLQESLGSMLARCSPAQPLAVFVLDLDGFKPVNDRLGHDAGDTLLVQVAHRLRGQLRGGDVVARVGGDEFVVAVPVKAEDDARVVGGKLLDAIGQPFDVAGQRCRVGLTVGYAIAPLDGSDAAALLKLADAAMYAGKQAGRHCLRRSGVPQAVSGAAT